MVKSPWDKEIRRVKGSKTNKRLRKQDIGVEGYDHEKSRSMDSWEC